MIDDTYPLQNSDPAQLGWGWSSSQYSD